MLMHSHKLYVSIQTFFFFSLSGLCRKKYRPMEDDSKKDYEILNTFI